LSGDEGGVPGLLLFLCCEDDAEPGWRAGVSVFLDGFLEEEDLEKSEFSTMDGEGRRN
jgi:hypothetical protein